MDIINARPAVREFRPWNGMVADPSPDLADFLASSNLDLEIGCGVGLHPLRYVLQNPERRLIAIEHTQEKFAKFARRFANHGSPANLLAVHANAITWVHHRIPAESLAKIFILYPNPNPQNKAKRWIQMPFMGRLLDSLRVGGELCLATNISWYAEELRELAPRLWQLEPVCETQLSAADVTGGAHLPRTHFEKKYLERGEICFDLVWRKSSSRFFHFSPPKL